jgi:hypothetical protein
MTTLFFTLIIGFLLAAPVPAAAQGVHATVSELAARDAEIAEALAVHRAYLDAVRAGYDQEARAAWHPDEVARYPRYDWALDYRRWRHPLPSLIDSIIAARHVGDHVELTLRWISEPTRQVAGEDRRLFVRHQGRLVGVNPIRVETGDWTEKRGERLVYHWPAGDDPFDEELMAQNERRLAEAAGRLAVELPERIDFYLCRDRAEVGRLFGLGPSMMRAHAPNAVVATLTPYSMHGTVRALYYAGYPDPARGNPFGAVAGGIAYALAGGLQATPEWMRMRGRELVLTGELPGLRKSFAELDADETTPYAPHMAAVCEFVLARFGADAFFDWGLRSRHWSSVHSACQYGLGVEWDQLRPELEAEMTAVTVPWIAPAGSEEGESGNQSGGETPRTLLTFDDAAGDAWPVLAPPPGMAAGALDLRRLHVEQRDGRVIVTVTLASPPPAGEAWGFDGLMLQILVATGEGAGTDTVWDTGRDETRLERPVQRLIDVSPQGVLVQSWRGEWLGGRYQRVPGEAPLVDGRQISVSIPVELLGTPDPAWRYQVLVTGHQPAPDLGFGVGSSRAWMAGGLTTAAGQLRIYDLLLAAGEEQGAWLDEIAAGGEIPLVGAE